MIAATTTTTGDELNEYGYANPAEATVNQHNMTRQISSEDVGFTIKSVNGAGNVMNQETSSRKCAPPAPTKQICWKETTV